MKENEVEGTNNGRKGGGSEMFERGVWGVLSEVETWGKEGFWGSLFEVGRFDKARHVKETNFTFLYNERIQIELQNNNVFEFVVIVIDYVSFVNFAMFSSFSCLLCLLTFCKWIVCAMCEHFQAQTKPSQLVDMTQISMKFGSNNPNCPLNNIINNILFILYFKT